MVEPRGFLLGDRPQWKEGRQGKFSALAGFLFSKFYSTQAYRIGDGATHIKDKSSQTLVVFENILIQDMFRGCFTNVLGVSQSNQIDNLILPSVCYIEMLALNKLALLLAPTNDSLLLGNNNSVLLLHMSQTLALLHSGLFPSCQLPLAPTKQHSSWQTSVHQQQLTMVIVPTPPKSHCNVCFFPYVVYTVLLFIKFIFLWQQGTLKVMQSSHSNSTCDRHEKERTMFFC